MRDVVTSILHKKVKGKDGSVAAKSVESLQMLSSGLKRLKTITSTYLYQSTKLLACLSLDCEHFHASQHVKRDVMSMQRYCQLFSTILRESVKRKTKWSAHYCTTEKSSWYPVSKSAIPLNSIPAVPLLVSVVNWNQRWEDRGRRMDKQYRRDQTASKPQWHQLGQLPTYIYELKSTETVM